MQPLRFAYRVLLHCDASLDLMNRSALLREQPMTEDVFGVSSPRCSRLYWSTVNPLRRCKYTCTVQEVRPPVPEHPPEETPDRGHNHTTAHSPPLPSGTFLSAP